MLILPCQPACSLFSLKEKSFPTRLSLAVGLKSHNMMKQDLNSHFVKKKKIQMIILHKEK